ncbi:MAG TPA: heavy metal translocating P-type ATPase [Burkholderiaceae bacterium]|jgi:heavy metal translocating P-type ATPase
MEHSPAKPTSEETGDKAAHSCCAVHEHGAAAAPMDKPYTDPVCGMRAAADPARSAEYDGKIYYFCGKRCVERFVSDPLKYLQPAQVQEPTLAESKAIYTCPMHPEVEQIGPGSCPKCGMALEPCDATAQADDSELRDMTRRFWIGLACSIPLLVLGMGDMMPGLNLHAKLGMMWFDGLQAALATPVVLWCGWPFLVRAVASFKSRQLNMFSLIGLGTSAAYLFSLVSWLMPDTLPPAFKMAGMAPVYFEAAAVIVTLVLMGQVLELRARSRTNSAIQSLMQLVPDLAWRVAVDGSEQEIALDKVQIGDRLRVKPGGKVPVDGEVVDGNSQVDESMLSGEPMPVEKKQGDKLSAGTINQVGSLLLRADKVGRDTLLAHIVQMVGDAGRSRAPIQKLADKVSSWFVPAVIGSALLSFAGWALFGPAPAMANGLVAAVSVLIVACPCALGLATPVSIMLGVGRGAMAGVLIKNAEALETLEKIDVLAIDKTGTLTEGKASIQAVQVADGGNEESVLRYVASLETLSEHPLGRAILRYTSGRGIVPAAVSDFRAHNGLGVSGLIDGLPVLLGSLRQMQDAHVDVSSFDVFAADCARYAHTLVYVATAGRAAGALSLADPVKPGAADAVRQLRASGVRVVMLTGDNAATAEAVARTVGIEEYHAGLLPQDKLALLKQLQIDGHRVAMAGDGINDAPALAQADVGIAMGSGTDIAMQSAGVVLPKGDLAAIVRARTLSRLTMRNIRQNLFFAFVYNFLGVPLAAGVFFPWLGWLLSPMIASAAMSFSSVSVITNALRLRHADLDTLKK